MEREEDLRRTRHWGLRGLAIRDSNVTQRTYIHGSTIYLPTISQNIPSYLSPGEVGAFWVVSSAHYQDVKKVTYSLDYLNATGLVAEPLSHIELQGHTYTKIRGDLGYTIIQGTLVNTSAYPARYIQAWIFFVGYSGKVIDVAAVNVNNTEKRVDENNRLAAGDAWTFHVSTLTSYEDIATALFCIYWEDGEDITPPKIVSGILVSDITSDSATITWTTDEPSSSIVQYGTTAAYGMSATGADSIINHSVILTELSASTTYHYRVGSTDLAGNGPIWSADKTFATLATPLLGDFSGNGKVWTEDFVMFVTQFGCQQGDTGFESVYDLDEDGRVWTGDFAMFVAQFGKTSGTAKTVAALSPMGKNQNAELAVSVQTRATTRLSSERREFTVEFSVENTTELRAYGLTLDYDPQSLEFLGATVGKENLLNKAGGSTPLFLVVSNPEEPGQVWIANAVSDFKLTEGDGLLASLNFRTRGELSGSTLPISFSVVELYDAQLHLNSISTENLMKQIQLVPGQNWLAQNYPNPFNPATCINYQLARPAFVTLKVYNVFGQLVKTLVKEEKSADWHSVTWDGRDSCGRAVASGIYFYHLSAGEFSKVHKMLLLK